MDYDNLLKSLLEHSGRMVYTKDLDGRYLQVNAAFLEMVGRTEAEVLGKTNYDFFPAEFADRFRANDLKVVATAKACEFEQTLPSNWGSQVYTAVKFPLFDENNEVYAICGITGDITERKFAELQLQITMDQLQKSNAMLESYRLELERSNRDLERFATVAAHDLKSPLRAITQHLELIAANQNNVLDERAQKSMGFVMDGARRMRELIEALLEYSYLSFSEKVLVPLDLNKVLLVVRTNLAAVILETQAQIVVEELPVVVADKIQMTQLFQNLIGNAMAYCHESPHIHIRVRQEKSKWIFSVADNGIGIAPHNLENVFLIFKRFCDVEHYKGSGIGLAICDRVVKNHKGRIWVESTVGKGSTFFFSLPVHSIEPQALVLEP